MRLDLASTWNDAAAMIRRNRDVLSAVAGMFLILPMIVSGWLLPDPGPLPEGATMEDLLAAQIAYFGENAPVILTSGLVVTFGTLSMLVLLVHPSRPVVSDALRLALRLLPAYLLANLLQSLAVFGGFLLFILPGVYLIARLICIAPVLAAEEERGPVALLMRSWAITRGSGLRILLMLAIIFLVAIIVSSALSAVVGIVAGLVLPADVARLVTIIAGALVEAALAVAIMAVSAAIYRAAPRRP